MKTLRMRHFGLRAVVLTTDGQQGPQARTHDQQGVFEIKTLADINAAHRRAFEMGLYDRQG